MFKGGLYNTRKRFLMVFPIILILAAGILIFVDYMRYPHTDAVLRVYAESGFYSADFNVKIAAPRKSVIMYTTDCSEPSRENGEVYKSPIKFVATENEMVHTLKVKAFLEDGTETDTLVRNYIVGRNINDRYDTKVLVVAGEPEDLFGYEKGLFVPGKIYDEFKAANPDSFDGNGVEANFMQSGRDSERKVYIQFFDEKGNSIIEQNCGLRIKGGATRLKNQKSFTLYARKGYDEQNRFEYNFFEGLLSDKDNTMLSEYKELVVRNSGQDNGFAFLRSELVGRLAAEAGFPDVMHATPVCVYINGTYQGVYWLENSYDEEYFEGKYGHYTGEFIMLEGSDTKKEKKEDENVERYVREYNSIYKEFSSADLTDDKKYEELCKLIDIENYLQYFAIENYVANYDWPSNNERVYRYVDTDGNYEEGTVFDGRYRFMLYDVDYGFGLLTQWATVGILSTTPTLDRILDEESTLFKSLMERKDCRDYFVGYTMYLMNGAMSGDNVNKKVDEMHGQHYNELRYMLNTDLLKNSLWVWENEDGINMEQVEENIGFIKAFAGSRPQTVINDIIYTWGYQNVYILKIDCKNILGNVDIDGLYLENKDFEGRYFGEVPVTITAHISENEVFDCFSVNGVPVKTSDTSITLSGNDIDNGEICVSVLTHAKDEPELSLYSVKSKGDGEFIEIINYSDKEISTNGYYLSDDVEEPYKYAIPEKTLAPGEIMRFYGDNTTKAGSSLKYVMKFNIKTGETVVLTKDPRFIEQITVPQMSENGVYRKNLLTRRFEETIDY